MDDIDIDVDEFLARIRGNKPPFTCPFDDCLKLFRSFSAISKHLISIHKKSKEIEICEIDVVNDENKDIDYNSIHSNKDNDSAYLKTTNMKQTSKFVTDTIQLSYADSKKFVILQNDKRSFRCNVNVPIYISIDEEKMNNSTVISELNTNTVHDENSNDTSQSEMSNNNNIKRIGGIKRKRSFSFKNYKKIRKLNDENKEMLYNSLENKTKEMKNKELERVLQTPVPIFIEDVNLEDFEKETPHDVEGYVKYVEKTAEELDEIVEYDLDEEDLIWLPKCNEYLAILEPPKPEKKKNRRSSSKICPTIVDQATMEYVIDRFEKECHFESIAGSNLHNDIDEDAVCDVCLDGTCDNSNVILFCDVCNLAVHQECYGVPYVPEGQWLCRKCLHSPSHPVDCCLCPNKGGAFKQTNDNRWAHVVCGLWIPEIMFANLIFLEPIENVEKIEAARWRLACYLCKQKNVGACIQCHKSNCYTAFHVTCAQQAGLYMKIEQSEKISGPAGIRKSAFCDVHSPSGYKAGVSRGMYANSDEEMTSEKPGKRQKKLKDVRKLLNKRRNYTAPISFPVIPPEKLKEITDNINIQNKEEFMNRIHAYWKMKREYRSGVPLLRRLVASSSKSNLALLSIDEGSSEMISNLKFWQQIRQDLEKARLLSELSRKREKIKRELFRNFISINDTLLYPTMNLTRDLIDELQTLDTGKIFSEPVTDAMAPNYSKIIQSPMDFTLMRKKHKSNEYVNIEKLRADFDLMMSNCQRYNARNTIYYNMASKLRTESVPVFERYERQYEEIGFDKETGLFANKSIYDLVINSNFEDDHIYQLEKELNKVPQSSYGKLLIESNNQINPPRSLESYSSSQDESYSMKTGKESNSSNVLSEQQSKVEEHLESIEEMADSQQNYSLRKMPATSSTTIISISSSLRRRNNRLNKSEELTNSYFRVSSTHTDPDSTFDTYKNEEIKLNPPSWNSSIAYNDYAKNAEISQECHDVDDEDSAHDHSNNVFDSFDESEEDETEESKSQSNIRLEPLDLVWAKCRGYPWFPGLIVDPFMSSNDICDNKVPIPNPPENVRELGRLHSNQHKFLVLFFDKKRTWQWLDREKLEPFAVKEDIDRNMLQLINKSRKSKSVHKAYKDAIRHLCSVNCEPYPYDEFHFDDEISTPFLPAATAAALFRS